MAHLTRQPLLPKINPRPPQPMPAVVYARFSTDKQRESSVEDQARVCRARAELLGLEVLKVHADHGVSGSTPVEARPGGKLLLADALARRFDVLLVESLDRLSRDSVESESIVRRLEHRGIRIIGCADGYDTASGKSRKLLRAMRSMINETYLDDLREKTHRGLAGQVERGFHAGGISFGYRSVQTDVGHRLEIDDDQAKWVRWMFDRYNAGASCRAIAGELNTMHVASPRSGTWAASALYGSPAKGSGILNNELYVGRYVWNRSQWTKDPDTGKRERIVRPQSEWQIVERPELQIVRDDVWQAAQARIRKPRAEGGGVGAGPRPTTLFGGMLRCGKCGGPMTAIDAHRYGCSRRKERGDMVCEGVAVPRRATDVRLLALVRDELMTPEAMAELDAVLSQAVADQRRSASRVRTQRATRLAIVDREIARLVDAIANVGLSPALQARLQGAEAEKATLAAIDGAKADFALVDAVRAYRQKVLNLREALAKEASVARGMLREFFGDIRVVEEGDGIFAEVETRADAVLLQAVGGDADDCGCGGLRFIQSKVRLANRRM